MKTLFVIWLLAVNLQCSADYYQIGPLPSSVPKSDTMSALKARDLSWQTEKWTGSDEPFIKAVDQIEASLKAGASIGTLLDSAEKKAIQQPYDAATQLVWCFTAYKAIVAFKIPDGRNLSYNRLRQRLSNSTQGMIFGSQPHSYIYNRLLFLAREYNDPNKDYMVIGHRLIARDPEDDEVRRAVLRIDMDSFYPPRTQEALDYAHFLFRKSPNSARLYYLLGDIYYGEFLANKQHYAADMAIANWHKGFQLEAPSKAFLETVQDNVKWIHKVEAKQANRMK